MPRLSNRPFDRAPVDKNTVAAVKALAAGQATEGQQKALVEFVLHDLCGVDELSFRPEDAGGERDTAFAEGKRWVGLQLRRIILVSSEKLTGGE